MTSPFGRPTITAETHSAVPVDSVTGAVSRGHNGSATFTPIKYGGFRQLISSRAGWGRNE